MRHLFFLRQYSCQTGNCRDKFRVYPVENDTRNIWERLSKNSGFPEPYLNGDSRFYQMWSNAYKRQLLREDIRDFAAFRNMDNVESLFSLLPSRIGNPVSMSALANDIRVSFDSVKGWLSLFENFFLIFRIAPWTRKISRAITKEKKLYLFDYAGIESPGAKFENMVAVELYRAVVNWTDRGFGRFSLHYIRNREKEEVDFLVVDSNKPFFLLEVKMSDDPSTRVVRKFQDYLGIPAVVLVNRPNIRRIVSNGDKEIMIASADQWLSQLP